jgi:hypothetical protein
MPKLPWKYDPVNEVYLVNKVFYRMQSFLTIAFFIVLASISLLGGK